MSNEANPITPPKTQKGLMTSMDFKRLKGRDKSIHLPRSVWIIKPSLIAETKGGVVKSNGGAVYTSTRTGQIVRINMKKTETQGGPKEAKRLAIIQRHAPKRLK